MKVLNQLVEAGVPTLVWGPPGVGKTALIRSLTQRRGWRLVEIIASLHDPTDFNGLPVLHNGSVRFAPPDWVYQFEESGQGILFLDELTTAPPTVQAALLRLVLERKVGAHSLPAGVRVVAAANPPEMAANGWELAPPLANRFAHLQFQLDAGEWVKLFPSYWGNPPQLEGVEETIWSRARARVAAFISRRPNLLYTYDPTREETRFASPRTWDLFSRAWAAAHLDSSAAGDLAAALVGDAPARESRRSSRGDRICCIPSTLIEPKRHALQRREHGTCSRVRGRRRISIPPRQATSPRRLSATRLLLSSPAG